MSWWLIGFLVLSVTIVVAALLSWIIMSYQTFPKYETPGTTYQVGEETRTIPGLPHKRYGTKEEALLTRPVPLLAEADMLALDALIVSTLALMDQTNIPYWVTGGSLIAAMLWGYPMCYDDDADLSVLLRDKSKLWTPEFIQAAQEMGLEVFVMRGVKRDYAPTKDMSALRLRKKGTYHPVVDLFFLDWDEQQERWAHVNGWNGEAVYFDQTTEVWEKDWLFPLQRKPMNNGQQWPIPAQPEKMLDKHYGPEWSKFIKSPSPLFKTHKWAFWISHNFSAWKVLTPEHPGI